MLATINRHSSQRDPKSFEAVLPVPKRPIFLPVSECNLTTKSPPSVSQPVLRTFASTSFLKFGQAVRMQCSKMRWCYQDHKPTVREASDLPTMIPSKYMDIGHCDGAVLIRSGLWKFTFDEEGERNSGVPSLVPKRTSFSANVRRAAPNTGSRTEHGKSSDCCSPFMRYDLPILCLLGHIGVLPTLPLRLLANSRDPSKKGFGCERRQLPIDRRYSFYDSQEEHDFLSVGENYTSYIFGFFSLFSHAIPDSFKRLFQRPFSLLPLYPVDPFKINWWTHWNS